MGLQLVFNPFTGTFDWVSADAEAVVRVPFTYSSGVVLPLAVEAGSFLDGALVSIETVFDDPAATIQLGTMALPSLVFGTGEIVPTRAHQYSNREVTSFPVNDFLQLTVNPAGSTQGSGFLLYRYRR